MIPHFTGYKSGSVISKGWKSDLWSGSRAGVITPTLITPLQVLLFLFYWIQIRIRNHNASSSPPKKSCNWRDISFPPSSSKRERENVEVALVGRGDTSVGLRGLSHMTSALEEGPQKADKRNKISWFLYVTRGWWVKKSDALYGSPLVSSTFFPHSLLRSLRLLSLPLSSVYRPSRKSYLTFMFRFLSLQYKEYFYSFLQYSSDKRQLLCKRKIWPRDMSPVEWQWFKQLKSLLRMSPSVALQRGQVWSSLGIRWREQQLS